METKMKGKEKRGKAIIGIAMAAIMLASVFAAMIGSTGALSMGIGFNIIKSDQPTRPQTVLKGQDLCFNSSYGWPGNIVTISRVVEGYVENTYPADTNNQYFATDTWPTTGSYYVNYNAAAERGEAQLSVVDASIPISLKVGEETVSSTAVGTNLIIDTSGINLFPQDRVDLIVIGPDGQIKTDVINNQKFTNLTVSKLTDVYGDKTKGIETEGWETGSYTFQIKTKSEYACGLERETGVEDLSIVKGKIDISAEKTTAAERDVVKLTVTGVWEDEIEVGAKSADAEFQGGTEDTPMAYDKSDNLTDTIDEDGKRTYAIMFTDTGSYTIKATVQGGDRDGDYDTVDITVTEKKVIFDMPTTVTIGERLTVKGTSNTGDWVQIAVEDEICDKFEKIVIDENGEFEEEIDTSDACEGAFSVPGSVRLKAFITNISSV